MSMYVTYLNFYKTPSSSSVNVLGSGSTAWPWKKGLKIYHTYSQFFRMINEKISNPGPEKSHYKLAFSFFFKISLNVIPVHKPEKGRFVVKKQRASLQYINKA